MSAPGLDIAFVRRQFPALVGKCAYFDNAGGTQILERVVDRISRYLLQSNVMVGASYPASQLSGERIVQAATGFAEYCRTRDSCEVVFGPSVTQLLANLALAMRSRFQEGDEIVVTNVDHEANIGPWRKLQEVGVKVRVWEVNRDSWHLELEDLQSLLGDRTRLVCFPHVSNILGAIEPVAEIVRLAHQCGARVCVDGAAYAPHRALDIAGWDVDFYLVSLYKFFGPHNALLLAKREAQTELDSINHDFIDSDDLPYKIQPGKFNFELSYASLGILDYLEELGTKGVGGVSPAGGQACVERTWSAIARYEAELLEILLDDLLNRPGVRLMGPKSHDPGERVAIVSFVVDGVHSREIPRFLDDAGVGSRAGHFHAQRLVDELGLSSRGGVVRISMAHYNTRAEVEGLVRNLDVAFSKLGAL